MMTDRKAAVDSRTALGVLFHPFVGQSLPFIFLLQGFIPLLTSKTFMPSHSMSITLFPAARPASYDGIML